MNICNKKCILFTLAIDFFLSFTTSLFCQNLSNTELQIIIILQKKRNIILNYHPPPLFSEFEMKSLESQTNLFSI